MTSERRRHPVRPLRGRFVITSGVVEGIEQLLPAYRGVDGDHEGIAFLLGRQAGEWTWLLSVVGPNADHGWSHVRCSEADISEVVAVAKEFGLGLLAQVHSHPGGETEHSDGDDQMVLLPFQGMLSIVAPHYGRASLLPLNTLGVHQFQDGEWVLADPQSVAEQVAVVPTKVDLR